ncbi:MAG TPA: substrate-binding domain-containing protein [Gemmataceae bacterium]|nr:substrate-binding domain-containing protein [Gemmataceae bacterium]
MRPLSILSRLLVPFAALALFGAGGCGTNKAEGQKRIIILTNGNSPFWDACRVGLEEANTKLDLKNAGLVAELDVNNGTPKGQIDKLRQYASQDDVVAVGVSALDAANVAVADELRGLQKKGVKILTIDSDVDRDQMRDVRFAFVGTDNLAGGRELGKCAKGVRPDGGEYVTFVGRKAAQNAMERIGGFAEGAGPKFKSADSMGDDIDPIKARENVRNAMTNHPAVKTLVGIWSYNAPAIVDVVEEKNARDRYTVVVFDAEPLAIEKMGKGMIDAMVVQNPYEMGFQGVRLMKALHENDQKTIKEMLPNLGQKDGDIYDTGLKVVVPDEGSSLKQEMFQKNTQFLTLGKFKEWLAEKKLTGS